MTGRCNKVMRLGRLMEDARDKGKQSKSSTEVGPDLMVSTSLLLVVFIFIISTTLVSVF